jgi:nucleolar complex protein 3
MKRDTKLYFRSKKEIVRLHQINKPARIPLDDNLPPIHSHGEDEDSSNSGSDIGDISIPDSASDSANSCSPTLDELDSDAEMPYEAEPRKRHSSWDSDVDHNIPHLPTKLADGRIQKSTSEPTLVFPAEKHGGDETDDDAGYNDEDSAARDERYCVEDVSTGARFGRPAVVDVIRNTSRKTRIQGAKEQIAGICQEIIADPENSVSTHNGIAVGVLSHRLRCSLVF